MATRPEWYSENLQRSEWKCRRLEVLERANFRCQDCGAAGVPLLVHHLRYERGKKPWEYPDNALRSLCGPCHERVTGNGTQQRRMRDTIRSLAGMFAGKMALPRPARFPANAAWRWVMDERPVANPKAAMQFMAWLWKDGVTDIDLVKQYVRTWIDRSVRNPYSYFAKGSPGRECPANVKASEQAEAENNARKSETDAWLRKGG